LITGSAQFFSFGFCLLISAASPPVSYSALNRQKLSREYPVTLQACDTFPDCFAGSRIPIFVLMNFLLVCHALLLAGNYIFFSIDLFNNQLGSGWIICKILYFLSQKL
jgi:hypothetical protein